VQLLWKCPLSDDSYVSQRAWESAILDDCPFHPEGGLLPSFLAARLRGSLASIEDVVAAVEAAGSLAAAVDTVHPPDAQAAIGLASALRSLRRRVSAVRAALLAIATLLPDRFAGVRPTLASFRERLGTARVLVGLRELASHYLGALPVPLGFRTRAPT
jgi:hypothetical protein